MNLVPLELARWAYLILYIFLPMSIVVYLVRTFGLKLREDPLGMAQRHIEQARYWADIAIKLAQSQAASKSLSSLEHTIERNLNNAAELLQEVESGLPEAVALVETMKQVQEQQHLLHELIVSHNNALSKDKSQITSKPLLN